MAEDFPDFGPDFFFQNLFFHDFFSLEKIGLDFSNAQTNIFSLFAQVIKIRRVDMCGHSPKFATATLFFFRFVDFLHNFLSGVTGNYDQLNRIALLKLSYSSCRSEQKQKWLG